MKPITNGPDAGHEWAEPGVFECGALLVAVADRAGETYWAGPPVDAAPTSTPDGSRRQWILRTCMCGGWQQRTATEFVLAPPSRDMPRPVGLCDERDQ